jgi:hypothetical protein
MSTQVMIQHIILFLYLITYSFIASQPMFYLLGLSRAVKEMKVATFIDFRNLVDNSLQVSLRLVYYLGLFLGAAWIYIALGIGLQVVIITASLSILALLTDIFILLKGNNPINKTIQGWDATNYPPDWVAVKNKWFMFYRWRQAASLSGFFCLIFAIVLYL